MKQRLRRLRNPDWWFAHRCELPTLAEWFSLILAVIILTGCSYVIHAAQVIELARDDLMQNQRILECLNRRGNIGVITEHGNDWDVECQLTLRKRI